MIASLLVSIYLSILIYLCLNSSLKYIYFLPLLVIILYCIFYKLSSKLTKVFIKLDDENSMNKYLFVLIFIGVFLGQMLYWMAFYPGGFNLDAYGQWDQVHGLMPLNNWHPVFTTGCYWLITRIKDNFAFCIFVQLFIFSFSVTCLMQKLNRLRIPKILIILSTIYIAINPAIAMNNVCLFKDVPFTIAIIWYTIITIKIITSNGEWLKSNLHLFYLIVIILIICLIRHNGFFIAIPTLLCLIYLYRNDLKRILVSVLSFLLIFFTIQGPVFSYLSVEKHSNVAGESIGIPMSIMANNLVNDYENTPEEVKSFLLSIADKEDWNKRYILGEWDSCKWEFGGIELFKDESLRNILKLTLLSIASAPNTAYQSIRENTRVVWQVFGFAYWDTWVYIEENNYGINSEPNFFCRNLVDNILEFSLTLIGTFVCWNIGVPNLIFILLIYLIVNRKEFYKLLLILPLVAYNLSTMMLLCGPSHRYFYFNSVLVFPIILISLVDIKIRNN